MFSLVIVEEMPDGGPQRQAWGAFHAHAGIERLRAEKGVHYIAMNAWIFDLRNSLTSYARVLNRATELGIKTLIVPLDETTTNSILSHPSSPDLSAFLKTKRV